MSKILLEIRGIEYSQTQSGSYVLDLKEVGGRRRMPILIGGFEAQAIALALEKMTPNRPMTHDLFVSVFVIVNAQVKEIIIHEFNEGLFKANIVVVHEGIEVDIDARSSDAVAIAVRFNAPIYTTEKVLQEVSHISERREDESDGVDFDEEDLEDSDSDENDMKEVPLEELEYLLSEALENEDYEKATRLRDEINKRKK
ncbi:MAG: bifunctional nuclease family protein [Bacteroidetes bacterium]|nr:bifunctional nuclease family protein [Bacteroidota bacterium]